MERIRTVIAYKNYFKDFLIEQPPKVQDKIFKIIEIIESQQRIPEKFLKHIEGEKKQKRGDSLSDHLFNMLSENEEKTIPHPS